MAWRALRQLTSSSSKSAGRNSAGRITIFHRGGGAKRLQRTLDLKRSTSSMGVVERIEYDPNRSSRIALVRWQGGPHQRKRSIAAAIEEEASARSIASAAAAAATTAANIRGSFAFSSLNPTDKKSNSAKDVFVSAFLSPKAAASKDGAFGFPRIAVAAANPAFFVSRMRERVFVGGGENNNNNNNTFSLSEIRKHSNSQWAHRMKRTAALSWHGFKRQEEILIGRKNQPKTTTTDQPKKNGARRDDWAAVTYVIATHNLEKGKKMMVMNCSKL